MFAHVFGEAIDTCFRHIYSSLKRLVFCPDNPDGHVPERQPALALLLPPLRVIVKRMLPDSASEALSREVKEVAAGPALDELCGSIFDAHLVSDFRLSVRSEGGGGGGDDAAGAAASTSIPSLASSSAAAAASLSSSSSSSLSSSSNNGSRRNKFTPAKPAAGGASRGAEEENEGDSWVF